MSEAKENEGSPSAIAKVFLTALETVDAQVKREILFSILENEKLFEEVEAMILWDERKDEPSIPFRKYLAQRENI